MNMTKKIRRDDPESALNTGHYVIATYRCSDPITKIDHWHDGTGACCRGETQIYTPIMPPQGEWYYCLNDGCIDVGPFVDRDTAIAHAKRGIRSFQYAMGGLVNSIAVDDAAPTTVEPDPRGISIPEIVGEVISGIIRKGERR
jgi:hypothetical protein